MPGTKKMPSINRTRKQEKPPVDEAAMMDEETFNNDISEEQVEALLMHVVGSSDEEDDGSIVAEDFSVDGSEEEGDVGEEELDADLESESESENEEEEEEEEENDETVKEMNANDDENIENAEESEKETNDNEESGSEKEAEPEQKEEVKQLSELDILRQKIGKLPQTKLMELDDKLKKLLHNNQQVVRRAYKKATTFEIQKLVKRIRRVREKLEEADLPDTVKQAKEKELEKFSTDLADAKAMNLDTLTEHTYLTHIHTSPKLGTNPLFRPWLKSNPQPETTNTSLKRVELRIQASKTIQTCLNEITDHVQKVMDVAFKSIEPPKTKQRNQRNNNNNNDKRDNDNKNKRTSKFLSSLNDSDAPLVDIDVSDSEDQDEWLDDPFPKKNRPGQRARRKQWEEKYGTEAKHVKMEAEKRAQSGGMDDRRDVKRPRMFKDNRFVNPPPEMKKEPAPVKIDESMHPSWIAAKKKKEELMKVMSQAPKAKKIVFNDSDDE